jgi:hypothetical protein
MAMKFEELDGITRQFMLGEFDAEQSGGNPYQPRVLSNAGRAMFPALVRKAIESGDEESLIASLAASSLWNRTETYVRNGVERERNVNPYQGAQRLGLTEFSTWYARGLTKRLIEEGVTHCQVYRAANPKWEPADCSSHEGLILSVEEVYRGHRARYWPEPGNPAAVSVPFGPGCHHTIRRFGR